MKAYKLFKLRADGTLGPLFINASQRLPEGVWLKSEDHPTKGFAHRPGWHCTLKPEAPHLSLNPKGSKRVNEVVRSSRVTGRNVGSGRVAQSQPSP